MTARQIIEARLARPLPPAAQIMSALGIPQENPTP